MRFVITKQERHKDGRFDTQEWYEEFLEEEVKKDYETLPHEVLYRLGYENNGSEKRFYPEHYEQIPDFSIQVMQDEMGIEDIFTTWSGLDIIIRTLKAACTNQLNELRKEEAQSEEDAPKSEDMTEIECYRRNLRQLQIKLQINCLLQLRTKLDSIDI